MCRWVDHKLLGTPALCVQRTGAYRRPRSEHRRWSATADSQQQSVPPLKQSQAPSYAQLVLGQQSPAAAAQLAAIVGAAGLQLIACAQLASNWQSHTEDAGTHRQLEPSMQTAPLPPQPPLLLFGCTNLLILLALVLTWARQLGSSRCVLQRLCHARDCTCLDHAAMHAGSRRGA